MLPGSVKQQKTHLVQRGRVGEGETDGKEQKLKEGTLQEVTWEAGTPQVALGSERKGVVRLVQ